MPRSCAARSRMAASRDRRRRAALAMPGVRAVITANDIGAVPRSRCVCCRCPGLSGFCSRRSPPTGSAMSASRSRVVLADSAALAEDGVEAIALDIEELPPVADRRASAAARRPAVRGDRHQRRDDLHRGQGRCRCGIPRGRLHPPRAVRDAAPHRIADGAARRARRMGCGAAADDRLGAAKVPFFNRRIRWRHARACRKTRSI